MKYIMIALLTLSSFATAGGYVGLSGNHTDTDISSHFGYTLHVGHQFNEVLGVEGRVLLSADDDNYEGVDVSIESLYGLYFTGALPINDNLSVYALFGHSRGEAKATYYGNTATVSDSGTSVGMGARFHVLEAWSFTAEYSEILDGIDQMSLGLRLNF